MTRRRNTTRHAYQPYKDEPEQEFVTFLMMWRRLVSVLKMRILPSKYLGRSVFYKGKSRTIGGETLDNFYLNDFPKLTFSKSGNKLPIR